MIGYQNRVFCLNANVQYKKISPIGKQEKYILYIDKRTYPIKGISAFLFESIVHFDLISLEDLFHQRIGIKKTSKKAILKCFSDFQESGWICEKEKEDMGFSLSSYTYCTAMNGKFYIINFLYKTFDLLTQKEYDAITKNHNEKLPVERLLYLYTRKYMKAYPSEEDISPFIKSNNVIRVFLVFSYQCNLKCTYCFEKDRDKKPAMDNNMLTKVMKYIDTLSTSQHAIITFYGGEPLLLENKNHIESIIRQFRNRNNISFSFVTNGYNTDEYIGTFNDVKKHIRNFMITLDGTKEVHDSRRVALNSQGSFDSIMRSINMLNENDYPVIIRINVDNENIGCQEELIQHLNKTIKKKKTVTIEYNLVEDKSNLDYDPIGYLECYKLYQKMKRISKIGVTFNLPIIRVLDEIRQNRNGIPSISEAYCSLDSRFVVDYDGRVYSCNEGMGNDAFFVGDVGGDTQPIKNKKSMNPDCRSCYFFIGCYGGCSLKNDYYNKQTSRNRCEYKQIKEVVDYFLQNVLGERAKREKI